MRKRGLQEGFKVRSRYWWFAAVGGQGPAVTQRLLSGWGGGHNPLGQNDMPPWVRRVGLGLGAGFVFSRGGSVGSETHPPKKILTQNLAEGKSSLNKRPLCGTY